MIDATPWKNRPHAGRPTIAVALAPRHRAACEALLRLGTTEQRIARRAQGLLLLADGLTTADVARLLGLHERTVFKWKRRFAVTDPTTRLADAPRSGRPLSLS